MLWFPFRIRHALGGVNAFQWKVKEMEDFSPFLKIWIGYETFSHYCVFFGATLYQVKFGSQG